MLEGPMLEGGSGRAPSLASSGSDGLRSGPAGRCGLCTRHIAVHMSQSRGLSASEMACWKLVGLVSNCDEWMALWRSEISAGWHGRASTRALNNVHHGSLAADQMPWKPHLPTALAPVTESLLSLPIVSSGSSLEGAMKLS